MKILLLEDDEVLAETLVDLLEGEGFDVELVKDGEEALERTFGTKFDLFLLDVNVPLVDGFELLEGLRASGDTTPAIFITALSDVASLSKGFDVGADDYIKKPFDFEELVVRINALLKKRYHTYASEIRVGEFRFNIEKEELYRGESFVPLPPYEKEIVKLLFQNVDKTLTKERLLEDLGGGNEMSEGALRVHIVKLRKIGLPITTIKGIGYRVATK